jgi:hypothetical protein
MRSTDDPAPTRPAFPAITISRGLGSEGTEIAFLASRKLGWRFCDRRILRMAAEATGHSVAGLSRSEERPCGWKDWVMAVLGQGSPEAPWGPLVELPVYSKDLFAIQKELILRLVEHAPSVIVGRGAFIALKGRPGTLHVSIHAALEYRVASLVRRGKAANAQEARDAIEASDRNRAGFIRAISGQDWKDPRLFGLQLDPSRDGPEACLERLVAEAGRLS